MFISDIDIIYYSHLLYYKSDDWILLYEVYIYIKVKL